MRTQSMLFICAIFTNTRLLISQGLFFHEDTLWESSGLQMHSKLIRYHMDGPLLRKDDSKSLLKQYFGEGADFIDSPNGFFVYQLTWQDRIM